MQKGLRAKVFRYMKKLKPDATEVDIKIVFGDILDREDYEHLKEPVDKWFAWDKTATEEEKKYQASMSHDNIMLSAIQLGYTKLYPELVMYE